MDWELRPAGKSVLLRVESVYVMFDGVLNKVLHYVLGNHILPDEDLASFHWSLLGPEHPLASLKVQIYCNY